jgi:tRNA G46 methylase TrmB
MQPDFLHRAAQRSSDAARLHFRTDHEEYFQAAAQVVAEHADWEIVQEPWPFEHETVFQSRAARHYSFTAKLRVLPHKFG